MSSPSTTTTRPIAWDPMSPARLVTVNSKNDELGVDTFSSLDGVGCNKHERSALMELLTAHTARNVPIKHTARIYRLQLLECLEGWEQDTSLDQDTSLELLKLVSAVMQLSDAFLLVQEVPDVNFLNRDVWSTPGAFTADTVRYLRLHHMADAYEGDELTEMLESSQPEHFGSYWKLLRTLVVRGCLEDAWALITRHSACRRSMEEVEILDPNHASMVQEDRMGFVALRSILLSAPLPGGRGEWNDAGFDDSTQEEEDNELLMDGVPRNAYMLWEARPTVDGGPIAYDFHAAMTTYNVWKGTLNNRDLAALLTRVPQLEPIMAILCGHGKKFDSWSEALCAELLYVRPGLCPKDIYVRTKSAMDKYTGNEVAFNDVILSVMQGDAGRAIDMLYQHGGGGSGAALPATMAALLCDLLAQANKIPAEFSIQTDLLLSASEAILASFASSEPDLGVRLATKLLLPHATPTSDARITTTLGETLQRHAPSTDSEAKALLTLVRDLVTKKSRAVLDGCIRMVLHRHKHYVSEYRPGGAIHWLLKGIELEALYFATTSGRRDAHAWNTVLASGVCGTLFCAACNEASQALLADIVQGKESATVGLSFARAEEIVTSVQEDDPSNLAHEVSELQLLVNIYEMSLDIVEKKTMANKIVACLDGTEVPLAHCHMYRNLLSLALNVLKDDEAHLYFGNSDVNYKTSFDVNGMRTLLEKFEVVSKEDLDVNEMRLALEEGLMRAIVAENEKRKEYAGAAHGQSYSHLKGASSSKLSSYSRSDQQHIVEMMLDPAF